MGSRSGPNSFATISQDDGGTGDFNGAPFNTVAFFQTGAGDVMNVASGFTTGFSFHYSSPFAPGSVTAWSGLDATGTELADIVLPTTPSGGAGCDTAFCPWVPFGVTFSGTAESVDFNGGAADIGFSDITLGSAISRTLDLGDDGYRLRGPRLRRLPRQAQKHRTRRVSWPFRQFKGRPLGRLSYLGAQYNSLRAVRHCRL